MADEDPFSKKLFWFLAQRPGMGSLYVKSTWQWRARDGVGRARNGPEKTTRKREKGKGDRSR
jgi:hypothetical protein